MGTSDEFITYVEDQLTLPKLTKKRMFGSVLLKYREKQLGIIFEDTLYFKIHESLQDKYRSYGAQQFQYNKQGKTVTIPAWWSVPEEVLENTQELNLWAREALDSHS